MKENFFKIETIKNGQEEVSFCLERGDSIEPNTIY
jgi:hypothetical protein